MCTNTDGSYVCRCKRGYSGDGKNCTGKIQINMQLFSILCFIILFPIFSFAFPMSQIFLLITKILMSAQITTNVTQTPCVPILKDPTSADVKKASGAMEEIAQVTYFLKRVFDLGSSSSLLSSLLFYIFYYSCPTRLFPILWTKRILPGRR